MADVWVRVITIIVGATLGSGGFVWGLLLRRSSHRNARERLMMGLAYNDLVTLGLEYINRGSITNGEFRDYQKYLYEPYIELGGNGGAKRMMARVEQLPYGPHDTHPEIFPNPEERAITNVRVVAGHRQDTPVG